MNILNKEQIEKIKIGGALLARCMDAIEKEVRPGVSTFELNEVCEAEMTKLNIRPSFKNYFVAGIGKYPTAACISVNEEIVHGIPSASRILKEGDIVSVDIGAEYGKVYTDMARTFPVGKISGEAQRLIDTTKRSLEEAIKVVSGNGHIGDIGAKVEEIANIQNLGIVRDYVGHGIGTRPHLPPQIPNYGRVNCGQAIIEGMALAIEPMLTLGDYRTKTLADKWTVVTLDGSLAAHFEHTVVVIDGKPVIVTLFSK
jgi:methionyl aminopeptidase